MIESQHTQNLFRLKLGKIQWIAIFSVLPIIFSQLSQRLFPIVDNHYIGFMGNQPLLIHNILYGFIFLGQSIGGATATCCLIFWNRSDFCNHQRGIFLISLLLCFACAILLALAANQYSNEIFNYFGINDNYLGIAKLYFRIGLANMILQAIYFALSGMIIAVGEEKSTLIYSFTLLILNLAADKLAIKFILIRPLSIHIIHNAMLAICSSMVLILIILNSCMAYKVIVKSNHLGFPKITPILKIWLSEFLCAAIGGIYPIIYAFQLGSVKTSNNLLLTYQLILQYTSIICIPLFASMQIALRNASNKKCDEKNSCLWNNLIYFGLIPTFGLLIIELMLSTSGMKLFFNYLIPTDHVKYVLLFFIATMVGQIGNMLTVPLRAKMQSRLVTISYFISDFIVMVGGMQIIILTGIATPTTTGVITLLYTMSYLFLNAFFIKGKLNYEKNLQFNT